MCKTKGKQTKEKKTLQSKVELKLPYQMTGKHLIFFFFNEDPAVAQTPFDMQNIPNTG